MRMQEWHTRLTSLPACQVSGIRGGTDEVTFDVRCGVGAEIARMRLRAEGPSVWRGSWECKTQFAGRPEHGGRPNFLSTHCCLIAALDIGHSLGLVESVSDDRCFWDSRQTARLLARFDDYENALASMFTLVRDAGFVVHAAVSGRAPGS